jgi:AraC family transcriptional regulator
MNTLIRQLYDNSRLDTLVENKQTFGANEMELHLYETQTKAFDFDLQFNDVSLITMFEGKKVMRLGQDNAFDFFPEESLILEKGEQMNIDFPEAQEDNPTRCMALIISPDEINETLLLLNEKTPKVDHSEWKMESSVQKFENDTLLKSNIERIVMLASTNPEYKNVLSKLMARELIVRLLQTNARNILLNSINPISSDSPLSNVIAYIRDNLTKVFTIDELAAKAYMSKASFFRHFKQELGISPYEFIISEKIKYAKKLLTNGKYSITDISSILAFGSTSYFVRHFRSVTGITPLKYRRQFLSEKGTFS